MTGVFKSYFDTGGIIEKSLSNTLLEIKIIISTFTTLKIKIIYFIFSSLNTKNLNTCISSLNIKIITIYDNTFKNQNNIYIFYFKITIIIIINISYNTFDNSYYKITFSITFNIIFNISQMTINNSSCICHIIITNISYYNITFNISFISHTITNISIIKIITVKNKSNIICKSTMIITP